MFPMATFQPTLDPLGSVTASALVALIPILVMLLTLGVLKWKAHLAGLASLLAALLVAVLAFRMPVGLAGLSALQGAAFGIFPITWILLAAIWMYDITVVSGRFEDLRSTFSLISDDPRVLGILVAFCFGGLLEALAGFGAPVAITSVMLVAIGYSPLRSALTVLLANTAPVAFGAIATPIIMAGNVSGLDYHRIGAFVGRQTAILALIVPFLMLLLIDGRKGLKQIWPAALVIGGVFSAAKWVTSSYVSVELTDVIASLLGIAAGVILMRFWKPAGSAEARERIARRMTGEPASVLTKEPAVADPAEPAGGRIARVTGEPASVLTKEPAVADPKQLTGGRIAMALVPYILVVVLFSLSNLVHPIQHALASTDITFGWPGLGGHILDASGAKVGRTNFKLGLLSSPGTLLAIVGIITAAIYRVHPRAVLGSLGRNLKKLRFTALTIVSVVALAYVMDFSGQTVTIGTWIAGTGVVFAFLSPILGWLGTYVTGSDTTANALFAGLQSTVGKQIGLDPFLTTASNASGGVLGKMISPQNLAIAATSVGLIGQESLILRRIIGWSLGLLVVLCLLAGLMSTPILGWLLPA
ncbi:L-lactate permease [Raineyella sp. LH-20]|uniref:L-lactate permease n=1 Tax=Raineyella sp. LH-20 TaxID=3081204 RepID=UPI0029548249|nr:L-lactate permease [Raineyella sp. LH-20]WOP17798.1 L-lactate permease [Raineyella sp. LH-20]